jgi:hypothetical protein
MSVRPSRLRGGEWLAAAGAIVMIVALFGLHWYGPSPGAPGTHSGWTGATHLHWLLALAILVGLGLVVSQAACRAPAIPACLSVISSVVAAVTVLWLLFRVVLDPGPHQQVGAWIELLGGLTLLAGSYWSLRQEGIAPEDGPGEIPVLTLPSPAAPAPSPAAPAPSRAAPQPPA